MPGITKAVISPPGINIYHCGTGFTKLERELMHLPDCFKADFLFLLRARYTTYFLSGFKSN